MRTDPGHDERDQGRRDQGRRDQAERGHGERNRGERGAALLTVLMLVAVIAVIAGGALEKLRLSTRLSGNAIGVEQARAYARAAEVMATTRIDGLLGRDATRVTLAGNWSGRPFGLPLPGGMATARVVDGGNCFNVNSLVTRVDPPLGGAPAGAAGIYASNPAMRVQFARLMRLLDVPAQAAETIAAGAADWIDTDQEQQANGAEDGLYLNREQPYRTAGTLMADVSELRAVNGMTPAIYASIRPWVCALPVAAASRININTIQPEQAPLLAMMLPDTMNVAMARQVILKRPPDGFNGTQAFWAAAALSGIVPPDGGAQTAVTTQWFALAVDVRYRDAAIEQHGLIDATKLPSHIVSRQWGEAS